jgi:hypothetical protein
MDRKLSLLVLGLALASAGLVGVACKDDSASSSDTPNDAGEGGTSSSGGPGDSGNGDSGDGGGIFCGQPAGCFCGTPTTQEQFLNRCTKATALPVNLNVKPATKTDIP